MLLAEALTERSAVLHRLREYPTKLSETAVWSEDDKRPSDDEIKALRATWTEDLDTLEHLNVAIHTTNNEATVTFESTTMTLMEAIAFRDRLTLQSRLLQETADLIANYHRRYYRSKDDVRYRTIVAPRDLRREHDEVAARIRRLDLALQQVNWTTHLIR